MVIAALILFPPPAQTMAEEIPGDNTMLMFVGEELDVLTIASRRKESAWQAPAVAQVITRDQIREQGIDTLGNALKTLPGFYMAQKEYGTQPYLRGIPHSALFLYDTVPMDSDITKGLHFLDHEVSLASIKRIEVVRGPGSMLWGPDAFAGIVNVVPLTGKDFTGVETGILGGLPGDLYGAYANMGYDGGPWDVFFSVSGRKALEDDRAGNLKRFWGDMASPVPPSERNGTIWADDSRYIELTGRAAYKDWLSISGRISDFRKSYLMSLPKEDLAWIESREAPSGFIKIEGRKELGLTSALRLTGIYSQLGLESKVIENILTQKEDTAYAEAVYDQRFLSGRGLLTAGVSFRNRHVKDAPVWDGYLPDFLGEENEYFLPIITSEDYDTRLWSQFAQYTHKFKNLDVWFGVRNDAHDQYQDHISYSTGLVWSPYSRLTNKLIYGTAYRTPYARQLLDEEEPDLEEINSLSLQTIWKFTEHSEVSACVFYNRIDNHILEDLYAGLSQANHQEIYGLEFEMKYTPVSKLDLAAGLTLMDNKGPDEVYEYNYASYVNPDGTLERLYRQMRYPYDIGADTLFNVSCTWRPYKHFTLFARLSYFSATHLIHPVSEEIITLPEVWLTDVCASFSDIVVKGLDLNFTVKNLFDENYYVPGTYDVIEGDPITAMIFLRKMW